MLGPCWLTLFQKALFQPYIRWDRPFSRIQEWIGIIDIWKHWITFNIAFKIPCTVHSPSINASFQNSFYLKFKALKRDSDPNSKIITLPAISFIKAFLKHRPRQRRNYSMSQLQKRAIPNPCLWFYLHLFNDNPMSPLNFHPTMEDTNCLWRRSVIKETGFKMEALSRF